MRYVCRVLCHDRASYQKSTPASQTLFCPASPKNDRTLSTSDAPGRVWSRKEHVPCGRSSAFPLDEVEPVSNCADSRFVLLYALCVGFTKPLSIRTAELSPGTQRKRPTPEFFGVFFPDEGRTMLPATLALFARTEQAQVCRLHLKRRIHSRLVRFGERGNRQPHSLPVLALSRFWAVSGFSCFPA